MSLEKVLVRLVIRATQTGAFGPLPPSGEPIHAAVLDLFQIGDGMFVEHWAQRDNLAMMEQIGALPA